MNKNRAVKNQPSEAASTKRTLATPQEFYKRFTQKPEVRELLSRLAKK
jgi:hypothetical protein